MSAAAIKIMTSLATKDFLAEFVGAYAKATGESLAFENDGGVNIAKRVRAGEVLDVVCLASNVVEALISEGKLMAGSKVDVVTSSAVVAVPLGAPQPDISTEAAFKNAILNAKSLCYSTGPSGVYLDKLFAQWGITDTIKGKLLLAPPGVPVGSLLAAGKAELGVQQLSELIHLAGIKVLGPLPPPVGLLTTFSAGISPACKDPDAARKVLAYMKSDAVAALKRKNGLEPA